MRLALRERLVCGRREQARLRTRACRAHRLLRLLLTHLKLGRLHGHRRAVGIHLALVVERLRVLVRGEHEVAVAACRRRRLLPDHAARAYRGALRDEVARGRRGSRWVQTAGGGHKLLLRLLLLLLLGRLVGARLESLLLLLLVLLLELELLERLLLVQVVQVQLLVLLLLLLLLELLRGLLQLLVEDQV